MPSSLKPVGLLTRGLKLTHLQLVAALARTGGMQNAADQLSIAQPAASRLASEIEAIIGQRIHRRAGKGIELTLAGQALAKRAMRALQEIDDAQSDIAEIGSGLAGNVRIGSVTGPAIEYILPVLREARLAKPDISISVEIATSDVLAEHLSNGSLDFMLGRIPPDMGMGLFDEFPIALEPVSFIARRGHALMWQTNVSAKQMLEYDWVLPFEGSILQMTILQELRSRGLSAPSQTFNTSSFLLTLALLRQSNAIAPISTSVANVFASHNEEASSLRVIDTEMKISVETFSLLKPAERVFPPATEAVYQMVLKKINSTHSMFSNEFSSNEYHSIG